MHRTLSYVEVSGKALAENVVAFRKYLGREIKIAGVVKGNAYGHGQTEVVSVLENLVDLWAVDDLAELINLRKVSKRRVMVLGFVERAALAEAIAFGGEPVIYDSERLGQVERIATERDKKVRVHIKIDALLGRQGLMGVDVEKFIKRLRKTRLVEVASIYSHFADVKDPNKLNHAEKQIEEFERAVKLFSENGYSKVETHLSATSGTLIYEKNRLKNSMIRIGAGIYGLWPSEELKERHGGQIELKSALRWITRVAQVKRVEKGFNIGYGLSYQTKKETRVAVIPQGYSDGFDRGLSNCGTILIRGQRCPVIGRVAMNMFVADVSHLKRVEVEDEVVLIGRQGKEEIGVEEIAKHLGTINYEVTTRISPLLPRILVD